MYLFDLANPFTLILIIFASMFLILISKKFKKSIIALIPLILLIILLLVYIFQLTIIKGKYLNFKEEIIKSLIIDILFIIITFISYLWILHLEKNKGKIKGLER